MDKKIVKSFSVRGFTLIELSIVLVIIGLIVGGILTGQDLINASAIRAQIGQIEKYNTAVNAFRNKYGYLPGDIPNPYAGSFGFQPRGQYVGEGDGNGIIQGNCPNNSSLGYQMGFNECGEIPVLWEDLSEAGLMDTTIFGYDTNGINYPYTQGAGSVGAGSIKNWLPSAKIGQGNFVYVWSLNGINYFAISTVTQIGWAIQSSLNPGLTVQQAYNIDKKTDDGLPQSGSVNTCYVNFNVVNYSALWAAGGLNQGADGAAGAPPDDCVPTTTATVPATTDCYGNNDTAGVMQYSLSQNANVQNCALSFRFQ